MTTGAALLQDLTARGVVLTAEAGRLRYKAPAGAVTPDLRRQLEAQAIFHLAGLVVTFAINEFFRLSQIAERSDKAQVITQLEA